MGVHQGSKHVELVRQWLSRSFSMTFFLMMLAFGSAQGSEVVTPARASGMPDRVYVEIDPRIELLSAVLSFTSWNTTMGPQGPGNFYFQELQQFFQPYCDHPAMKIAESLTRAGFTYDAPPHFILSLGSLPLLQQPVGGFDSYSASRAGGTANLEAFRKALADLNAVSGFERFFEAHRADYERMVSESAAGFAAGNAVMWLESFFGATADEYHLVLAPAMFAGGYGANFSTPDGHMAVYQVLSSHRTIGWPELPKGSELEYMSYHEWGHAYVNPAVGNYWELAMELGLPDLYVPVESIMRQQAYNLASTYLNEQVLRAVQALQIKETQGQKAYLANIMNQASRGFVLTPLIVQELEKYRANRGKYATFEQFVPVLFRRVAAEKPALLVLSSQILSAYKNPDRVAAEAQAAALMTPWLHQLQPIVYIDYDRVQHQGDMPFDIEVVPAPERKLISMTIQIDNGEPRLTPNPPLLSQEVVRTGDLVDGSHTIKITATDDNNQVGRYTATFVTANWDWIIDNIDKPASSLWFGLVDYSKVDQASEGWEYVDTPENLGEDAGRRTHTGDTAAYLVWRAQRLDSYQVTLYVAASQAATVGNLVRLSVASDCRIWEDVTPTINVQESNIAGWTKVILSGEVPANSDWFRLQLEVNPYSDPIQVGKVALLVHR